MSDPTTIKKNRATDIILVLKVIDGKAPLNSTGLTDSRLFTGDNNLHAIMDKQTCLWYLQMDSGLLPKPLMQRFTGLGLLMKFVVEYYKKRNIEIKEVID